jgi:hypothetical protein
MPHHTPLFIFVSCVHICILIFFSAVKRTARAASTVQSNADFLFHASKLQEEYGARLKLSEANTVSILDRDDATSALQLVLKPSGPPLASIIGKFAEGEVSLNRTREDIKNWKNVSPLNFAKTFGNTRSRCQFATAHCETADSSFAWTTNARAFEARS